MKNYFVGPNFRKMATKNRREILKRQFFYDCKCEHCAAPKNDHNDEYRSLACTNCISPFYLKNNGELEFRCKTCSHMINVRYFEDVLYKIEWLKKKGDL